MPGLKGALPNKQNSEKKIVKQKNFGFIIMALFASPAFSSADCGPAAVKAIQSQNSDALEK